MAVREVVDTDAVGHVVPVVVLAKVGELDRVLDEDGVILRPADERPRLAQHQVVILDWAPGGHLSSNFIFIFIFIIIIIITSQT